MLEGFLLIQGQPFHIKFLFLHTAMHSSLQCIAHLAQDSTVLLLCLPHLAECYRALEQKSYRALETHGRAGTAIVRSGPLFALLGN